MPRSLLRTVLLLAALLGAGPAPAADLPPEAVEVWARLDAVKQLRARFQQVQHRAILAQPLRSTGTLAFARPDRIRWEVEAPMASIFVLDGTKVATAIPALGHRETIELGSSPEAARLVQGLMVWLGGDLERVTRDYAVEWRSGPPHVAVLTPREGALERLLARIELTIRGEPLRVERVVLHEPGGDRVEIELRDIELAPSLPDTTFQLP